MPYIAVPGAVQIRFNQRLDGQMVQNTMYVEEQPFNADYTPSQMDDLAEAAYEWFTNQVYAWCSSELTCVSVETTDLTSQFGPAGSYVPTTPGAGAITQGSVPNNAAIVVSFRTASRGRRARGRNYIAGIPLTGIVGVNLVDPSYINGLTAAYQVFDQEVSAMTTWIWKHIVVSRADGVGTRYPVTSVGFTDNVLDSQRRRLPGRGN